MPQQSGSRRCTGEHRLARVATAILRLRYLDAHGIRRDERHPQKELGKAIRVAAPRLCASEHVREKWVHFSDILDVGYIHVLDIGYIRCLIDVS
jgi:hypothetical protein